MSARPALARLAVVGAAALVLPAPPAAAADAPPTRAAVFTRGADPGPRVVSLTLDADWYTPGDVSRVLQILRDNAITAGFALTARYVERYPDEVRAIAAAGHRLINHSYDHPYFTGLTRAQRFDQLDRTEAAFRRLGLTTAGWFRASYRDGYLNDGVRADLAARGYSISFDWTFDTTGYLGATNEVILDRVRRYTVPGGIVLMHLSSESTDIAALPSVIAALRSVGYGFTDPFRAVTHGLVGEHYAALGAQHSVLGAPRTEEMVATTAGTAVQWFEVGRVYWRDRVGAREVHGDIGARYVALGSVGSFLGYPVSDEAAVTGGRASRFRGETIYWSSTTGAHEVHGAILGRYLALSGTGSRLGMPVSDEYPVPGGRRSDVRGGWLRWDAATGAVTAGYR